MSESRLNIYKNQLSTIFDNGKRIVFTLVAQNGTEKKLLKRDSLRERKVDELVDIIYSLPLQRKQRCQNKL
jgi:hypothetical protein